MDLLKSITKIVSGLIIGVVIGLIIAAVGIVCFTDTSLAEYVTKLQSAKFVESMLAAGVAILAFGASILILIPLHEAGHLVCGLLSGYKFVSFRIFNWTFIRKDGKLQVKHYSIAGTGGQCLLTPLDIELEKIPTVWYNFGGVLVNIIAAAAIAPLLLIKGHPFLTEAVVIFLLTDVFIIIVNGIPMKIGGIGNDAYNMIALNKNLIAKRGMLNALRSNALIQQGFRPVDLPSDWFEMESDIDYSNSLEVSVPLMAASKLVDEMNYPEALRQFEDLYTHKKDIMGIYVKEIECELVFLRLVSGDTDGARELLSPELKKYIDTYRKMMSSKERILCAIYLLIENDKVKATQIYDNLLNRKEKYLLQGEVKSDLAIMKSMLE